ncbi:nucleotidyltransferase family protein [Methyloligella halotolerans]|nr:nucleotidyltransferase family protein [Methyloligella halotolerans]
MVLAAGLGTRMRPLSDSRPKPLVPVAGKALIDYVLDGLAASGVRRAVVNVHYLADIIEDHLKARQGGPDIAISDERDVLLDTGGGVKKALPTLGEGPFFIHNSDALWRENGRSALNALAALWDPSRMDALLLLAERETSLGYPGKGDFFLDDDGRLTRRGDAPLAPLVFAGVSLCDARLFEGAPNGAFSLNVLWDRALEAGRLYGTALDGEWMHIGTPDAVAQAEARLEDSGG